VTATSQLNRLQAELELGPAAHGWDDQRWTLARVAILIGRLFHARYTLRGTSYLLHRIGFSRRRFLSAGRGMRMMECAERRRRASRSGSPMTS